jgi:hypothetical protein
MPYSTTRFDDQGTFSGTLAVGDLVLDLDGALNYGCHPQFRIVARGMTDSVIGPGFLGATTPCITFDDSIQLVETDSLPWFP